MKLLYFTIQIHFLGGLSRIVSEKINWLVDQGYDVTLCNIERLDVKPAYPIDSRVKLIRGDISTTPGNAFTRIKGVTCAVSRVMEIIKEEQPDIIVNAHCPLVTWILPFVSKSGNLTIFKKNRIPTIIEFHQSRQGLKIFNEKTTDTFSSWLHGWSIRWIYSKYHRFVTLTTEDMSAWNLRNCIVIPNFSSIPPSEYVQDTERKNHQIIMLARLMPEKRIDLMIQIWSLISKKYPNWTVKVLGDGQMREFLELKIKEYQVQDSFFMPGAVKDVSEELEYSEIMCLTSEHEGLSLVLIEAMQKSVPVMAFEVSGIHDVINDGYNGFLVPFGNIYDYAEKLSKMIESPELRDQFRKNGKEFVKRFDKERVMGLWVDLFNSLK